MAETQNSKQNVQAPQAGQTVIVNAIPGQDIVLEAAFDQAEVKMDGGNVIFEFATAARSSSTSRTSAPPRPPTWSCPTEPS
jgi:3-hydroxyacyl-CoA dehydrogenase